MKKIGTFIGFSILSVLGGVGGYFIANNFIISNQKMIIKDEVNNKDLIKFTSSEDRTTSNQNRVDLTYASEKAVKSVVHIQTHFVREQIVYDPILQMFYGENAYKIREKHGQASGSGVIISSDGYIVTNNHVVQDAKEVYVTLNQEKYNATIIGTDPSTDLAVIKIKAKGLAFLPLANSDEVRLGQWVLAVGNPLNLQTTVTAGIVSAKNRNIDLLTSSYNPEKNIFPVESFIQTDAAVNSGNSGGALVNTEGDLVGINTAIASGTGFYAGYSFAIPSNIVNKVTSDLIKYGTVHRVRLGASFIENNSEYQQANGFATNKGVIIANLLKGGNGHNSGLEIKDIILEVNGDSVNSIAQLQEKLLQVKQGDVVKLKVMRGENQKMIDVMME